MAHEQKRKFVYASSQRKTRLKYPRQSAYHTLCNNQKPCWSCHHLRRIIRILGVMSHGSRKYRTHSSNVDKDSEMSRDRISNKCNGSANIIHVISLKTKAQETKYARACLLGQVPNRSSRSQETHNSGGFRHVPLQTIVRNIYSTWPEVSRPKETLDVRFHVVQQI